MAGLRRSAAMLGTLLALSACSGEGNDASPAATLPVSGTSAESASPSQASADPLEGNWVLDPVVCEKSKAAIANAGYTADDIPTATGAEVCAYDVFELRFLDGQLVIVHDGDVGWDGTYSVSNDRTFTAGDTGDEYITYRYEIDGDLLTIDMVKDDCPESVCATKADRLGENLVQTMIYETAPFERVA